MSFVLDRSVTLAWVYPDELTPSIAKLSEAVSDDGAWVPSLWHLEVGNNLALAVRNGRIERNKRDQFLVHLGRLNITTDLETTAHAWADTLKLADRFRLTLYDACYLELAQRLRLPLASLDRDLRAAANAAGIEPLGA